MHRVLRAALAQAVRWRMLARNPADAVKPPRPERKETSDHFWACGQSVYPNPRGRGALCSWLGGSFEQASQKTPAIGISAKDVV